jgi:hypothetical protein
MPIETPYGAPQERREISHTRQDWLAVTYLLFDGASAANVACTRWEKAGKLQQAKDLAEN